MDEKEGCVLKETQELTENFMRSLEAEEFRREVPPNTDFVLSEASVKSGVKEYEQFLSSRLCSKIINSLV